MTKPLDGMTALVTGASQSIGLASAEALVADGATVVITGRGEKSLTAARDAARVRVPGGRIEMFVSDACRETDLKSALEYAHGLNGRLDILVPTVGDGVMEPLLMRDAQSVREEMEVIGVVDEVVEVGHARTKRIEIVLVDRGMTVDKGRSAAPGIAVAPANFAL